jgi:hypothetical protein
MPSIPAIIQIGRPMAAIPGKIIDAKKFLRNPRIIIRHHHRIL